MLQALLKDRFQLEFRWETRNLPSLDLTVSEAGLRARPAAPASYLPERLSGPVLEIMGIPVVRSRLPTAHDWGSLLLISAPEMGTVRDDNPLLNPAPSIPQGSVRRIEAPSITAKGLADLITISTGMRVTDKTGLSGRLQLILEIALDEFVEFTRNPQPGADAGAESSGVILRAVRDSLKPYGLQLIPDTIPTEFFVIDRVDNPLK